MGDFFTWQLFVGILLGMFVAPHLLAWVRSKFGAVAG